MSAKAKNQQPEEPVTNEVTEEESPTEVGASSDEDVPMDYTMVAKLLRNDSWRRSCRSVWSKRTTTVQANKLK
jgi:hypothetical protein